MFVTQLNMHSLLTSNPNNRAAHQVQAVGAITAVEIGIFSPQGNTSFIASLFLQLGTESSSGVVTVTLSRIRGGVAVVIGAATIAEGEFSGEADLVSDIAAAGLISSDQVLVDVTAGGTDAVNLSVLAVEEVIT